MMLTSVEKNFEDLMKEIQAMPNEIVLQISRVSLTLPQMFVFLISSFDN